MGGYYLAGLTMDNIIIFIVVIGLLMLVVKFLKGLIKGIIALILILTLGVTSYNIFIAKKSVQYEVERYKTDYKYAVEMKNISSEASKAINEIKENKNVNVNVAKLVELKEKAKGVKHSEEANFIHNRYMNAFDTVITASKGYSMAKEAEKQAAKLEELSKGLDISFLDLLFGEK